MRRKLFIRTILSTLLITSFLFSFLAPAVYAEAKKDKGKHQHGEHHDDKDKGKDKNKDKNEDKSKDKDYSNFYLILVGQADGSYKAYKDIAIKYKNNVMVKAKPFAEALGLSYKNSTGYSRGWQKNGCTLSLGQDKNIYFRNKKTYYFYDYNSSTNKGKNIEYTAKYKHVVYKNNNIIHCATVGNLLNYKYYDVSKIQSYHSLGYRGVLVYNQYSKITKLPDISSVTNLKANDNSGGNPAAPLKVTIKPVTSNDSIDAKIKHIEATFTLAQTDKAQMLDLSEVLTAYSNYGLPSDGIYGYGNCDTAITIQGVDKNGYSVGEVKTTGSEFMIDFPKAVKLLITGSIKNLILDFTPVKPILISSNTQLLFNQIGWLFPSDGFARQYFVISEYMSFYPVGSSYTYSLSRKLLDSNCKDDPSYANSYQRITLVLKSPYTELFSSYCYINVQKYYTGINNAWVVFADTGNHVLAADYENKLIGMITYLSSVGLKTYLPSKNWNRQLVMKLPDNTKNTAYSYITIEPSALNLDHFYDYYLHLHEMVHYYEATQTHYGFRFESWTEGNATHLAIKTMDRMGIEHKDANGKDYFETLYATNFSFLTQNDKNNFEAYYLNASGIYATLIGYHFTEFLQDMYGEDVIYRIMEKVYAANIPTSAGRNSTYDKQFTDCIKAVTSQNVFQNFVEYCVD